MLDALRQRWRAFLRDPPGQRFHKRYERRGGQRGKHSLLKPLYAALGVLLAAIGVLFMAIPGPGIPILVLGAVMVAGESERVAHWLDRVDLRLRALIGRR